MRILSLFLLAFGLAFGSAEGQTLPRSFQANICGTVTGTSAPVCVQDGNGGNPQWGTINPTAHTFTLIGSGGLTIGSPIGGGVAGNYLCADGSVNLANCVPGNIAPAPGFLTYPLAGNLYAKFTQPSQAYLSPSGGQTTSFSAWLTSVSGTYSGPGTVRPYWTSGGLLANGTANTLRLSYDPVTLVPGALIEPASSNLATYSQEASNSVWRFTNTGVAVGIDNNATGLDGTTSAGTFRETAGSSIHQVWWRDAGITLTSGSFYAYQIYIKPVVRTRWLVSPSTMGTNNSFFIDFTNVTVSDPAWKIELLANGFYWLHKTFTANATAVPYMIFQFLDANGSTVYGGSTSAGFDLGGTQMEAVVSATSPPSTYMHRPDGTAVSRAADALAFTLPSGVTSGTYSFADGRQQVVSLSSGAYSVPTTLASYQITSFIDVNLTQVASPVLSVAGRAGNVVLQQADIAGLRTTDLAGFSGVKTSGSTQYFGSAIFKNENAMFQWTSGTGTASLSGRYVLIGGGNAGNALLTTSQSNAVAIGNGAVQSATSIAASAIYGDTAGGTSPSVTNSELMGNEGGNGPTVVSSQMFGNLAKGGGLGSTVTRSTLIGFQGSQFNGLTDTVALGANVLAGTTGAVGLVTQSLVLGSGAGSSVGALSTTMTRLILLGYNAQPPTPTSNNVINVGDIIKGDMAGGTYAVTSQSAGDAVWLSAVLKSKVYTVGTLPAAATAGTAARGFVSDAMACTFGVAVTGGGAIPCPVYSDNTNWLAGG